MKRILASILALTSGFAVNVNATNVWTGFKHIVQVEIVGSNGGFLIRFDSQISSSCTTALANGTELYIYPGQNGVSTDGVKALLASALAAYGMGKQIEVLYDNSDPHCYGEYIVIN